jgi:hypothetical protein
MRGAGRVRVASTFTRDLRRKPNTKAASDWLGQPRVCERNARDTCRSFPCFWPVLKSVDITGARCGDRRGDDGRFVMVVGNHTAENSFEQAPEAAVCRAVRGSAMLQHTGATLSTHCLPAAVLATGDLSERAAPESRPDRRRMRIAYSGPERFRCGRLPVPASGSRNGRRSSAERRIRPAGTILSREYKGRTITVTVLRRRLRMRGAAVRFPERDRHSSHP